MESGDGTHSSRAGSEMDALLMGRLYGELSEEEERRLSAALEKDEGAAAELEAFGEILGMYRSLPEEEPPAELVESVMAAAAAELSKKSKGARAERSMESQGADIAAARAIERAHDAGHEKGREGGLWAWFASLMTVPSRRVALGAAFSVLLVVGVVASLWHGRWGGKQENSGRQVDSRRGTASGRGLEEGEKTGAKKLEDEALAMADKRRGRGGDLSVPRLRGTLAAPSDEAKVPSTGQDQWKEAQAIGRSRRMQGAAGKGVAEKRRRGASRLDATLHYKGKMRGMGPVSAPRAAAPAPLAALRGGGRAAVGGIGGAASSSKVRPTIDGMRQESGSRAGRSSAAGQWVRARSLLKRKRYAQALVIYRKLGSDAKMRQNMSFLLEWAEAELMAGSASRTITLASRVEKGNRRLRAKAVALKRRAHALRVKRRAAARSRRARASRANALNGL